MWWALQPLLGVDRLVHRDRDTANQQHRRPPQVLSSDSKTLSQTYDNGWSFTNTFDGHTRISVVPRRGELREHLQTRELRPGLFFVSWIAGEMGLLAQIIRNGTVLAAVPSDDDAGTQIIAVTITSFDD